MGQTGPSDVTMVLTKESEDLLTALRSDATAMAHTALAPAVSIKIMYNTARPLLFRIVLHFLQPVCCAERRFCKATRAGTGLAQQSQRRLGPSHSPSGQLLSVSSCDCSLGLTGLAVIQVTVCLAKFHNPPEDEETESAEEDREQVSTIC